MVADVKNPPLVILGLDAGDPDFIVRWAQEGYLPTIASIMDRGCWGKTSGPELISEQGVWVSLFSGISRSQHGYYYLRQLKPGTYDIQPTTGLDAQALPFWANWARRDKKVAIVDVPDVYPVPGLAGIQLANWAPHHGWVSNHPAFAATAEPAHLLPEVRRIFGPQMHIVENSNNSVEKDSRFYRRLLARIEKKGGLCRQLLAPDHFDLVVAVFSESHAGGHQFWKYRPQASEATSGKKTELTHAIRDVYQAIDRQMGLILAKLPSDVNVVVASSVGMEDYYPTVGLMEAFCRQLGYQDSPKSTPLSLKPMALLRRAVPEAWRIALSGLLPRDTRERLLADQFRNGTNWQKTSAFAIPSFYTSFVRINLRGREPQGIVEPGTEYETVLDRLEADLTQLVDPQTGGSVVNQVKRTIDVFGGGLPVTLPDLFVEWKPGHSMQRVVHPKCDLVQTRQEFFRVSDHSDHGFLAAAGPSIRGRGALGDVSLLDLAPTFLSLMGESQPEKLKGKVIKALTAGRG
jgi:predicted AlkP superfamily phosphohydrolase/phosphomutase